MLLSNLLWVFLASTFNGSGVAQKVIRDQPDIFTQIGEAVTVNCRCETSWSSYNIFWYKQPPSGEMIFLTRDGRYSINFQRSLKSSSLTISTLQLEDSAKYFCAFFELTVLEAHSNGRISEVCHHAIYILGQRRRERTLIDTKTTQPNSVDCAEGEDVSLPCNLSTIGGDDYIHWYRQNPSQSPQYVIQGF